MRTKTASKICAALMALLLAIPVGLTLANPAQAKAAITSDTTGEIVVKDVKEGDTFKAYRFIETTYEGQLVRKFAPGFSYGDYITRSDDGLSGYLLLESDDSENSKIGEAAQKFVNQISDDSEVYTAAVEGGRAVFENLPMGQYVIIGTPEQETHAYQVMIGTVEPVAVNGEYVMQTREYDPKFVKDFVAKKPTLTLDKTADKEIIGIGDTVAYRVAVSIAPDSLRVNNVHIVDALDPSSVNAGMAINRDVKLTDGNGETIDNAVIAYTSASERTVGYTIDIPGAWEPGSQFIVEYTGDSKDMQTAVDIVNVAKTWCDDMEPIDDAVTVLVESDLDDNGTPQDGVEIDDNDTPLDKLAKSLGKLAQTGDIIPYVCLGAVLAAGIIIAIVLWRRKKNR